LTSNNTLVILFPMRKHAPIYYTIRTAVRVAFWGGLASATLLGLVELTDDDRPDCNITINANFTWEVGDYKARYGDQPVTECYIDPMYVLHDDGRWSWIEDNR
jgi:hypothetical protein